MREEQFDRAYASDLGRAVETAETILAESALPVIVDARLREFDFGEWEGLTWDEITQKWPRYAKDAWAEAKSYNPRGGETFEQVQARVGAFLRDLEADPVPRVLIATHAGVLHAALNVLAPRLSEDERALRIVFSPASVTRITMEADRARLILVNDVSHLNTVA